MHLNEAALGTILLGLPIGQLLTMPFSGRAVTRFGAKPVPVSYTHLDVYKRQGYFLLPILICKHLCQPFSDLLWI